VSFLTRSYKSQTRFVGMGLFGMFSSPRTSSIRVKIDLLIPEDPPVAGGTSLPDCKYGYCDIGTGAVEAKYSSKTSEFSTMSLLELFPLLFTPSLGTINDDAPCDTGVADRDGTREGGALENFFVNPLGWVSIGLDAAVDTTLCVFPVAFVVPAAKMCPPCFFSLRS